MAGISDAPFRSLAWRFGAGYAVAEMVAAGEGLWDTAKSRYRRAVADGVSPRAVQIAGGDPETVADAARRHADDGAEIIDINFGCPAKKVCRKAAGSQLLRDPDLVEAIVRAAVAQVDVPVTVKMRSGWSPELRNGVDVAARLEQAGVAAVTVHGRTRACAFGGSAEHDTVAAIKARVRIPVIANGDIDSPDKAAAVLAATGADGVMIGRAAQGRPWLLREISARIATGVAAAQPARAEVRDIILRHLDELHRFYGGDRGVRMARKHLGWYLAGQPGGGEWRRRIVRLEHPGEQFAAVESYFEEALQKGLAA
jgi:tRNA-dihydrouridine synthase B